MADNATQASDAQIITEWAGIVAVNPRVSMASRYKPFTPFQTALDAAVAPLKLQLTTMQNDLQAANDQIQELQRQVFILDKRHNEQCSKGL